VREGWPVSQTCSTALQREAGGFLWARAWDPSAREGKGPGYANHSVRLPRRTPSVATSSVRSVTRSNKRRGHRKRVRGGTSEGDPRPSIRIIRAAPRRADEMETTRSRSGQYNERRCIELWTRFLGLRLIRIRFGGMTGNRFVMLASAGALMPGGMQ
jgi:hypothetical protein